MDEILRISWDKENMGNVFQKIYRSKKTPNKTKLAFLVFLFFRGKGDTGFFHESNNFQTTHPENQKD